ncbi:glycoside hydrolase family 3 C-terminal domain-containing protein [Tunturiibacter empetritectus]|uniref:Beta-glucosidase n=1 Tax=Tunturiibacter lichenicola TaxID=2051959 RepID=A0A852VFA7_9BACT|nr:glycoside hydrolase family 3 C-terminal domain-containing protein [Edaphobacter lichenicola]NYF90330.1 beta-glucosidase [Edaphobacter lichenicola]
MALKKSKYLAVAFCLGALSVVSVASWAQAVPAEKADEARVDRLLKQMTLEEKMNLIRGGLEDPTVYQGQAGYLPGVPRLHVPSLRMADGPPGVLSRVAGQAETATMGVAATFSAKDAEANGAVIGREARSLGIDVVLQPFINIDRDITFARAYNTFGEDPMLSGAMGAAEVRGAQAQGVMAMAKHYVGYDSNGYNIFIDQQTLHEVYAAPFVDAIGAGVSSVMCSYNRINGPFACGNSDTLKTILKDEMGFKGFVTSDWGGVHSVLFLNEGLDMEMPGAAADDSPFKAFINNYFVTAPPDNTPVKPLDPDALAGILGGPIPEEPKANGLDLGGFPRDNDKTTMREALKNGTVTEATITAAARRVLYEIDRFGYLDGKQKHTVTTQAVEENAAVIRKTAEDAAVLLKNEHALPLGSDDLQSLALIGPGAGQVAAIGTFGERSPGLTERQISPMVALKKGFPEANITYAVDDDMTGVTVPASMLSHDGKPGLLRTEARGSTVVDAQLDFTHSNGRTLPANETVSWKGTLTVPATGEYWMYLQVLGARGKLMIDGKRVGQTGAAKGTVHGDVQYATQDNGFPTTDGLDNVRRAVQLTAGPHSITVIASGDTSNAPEQIRLNWTTPELRESNHKAAIETAKKAHTAVVFVWTRGKPDFALPGEQDKLVDEIAAVNPNTIVVMNVSQPVAMPWIGKVKGVLQMWWPGDEGGWATADVLLGKVSPAGRLPFTWAKQLTDYAANAPAHPERSAKGVDGKTTYSEGVDVGYRWFDKEKIEPLFPFGFGLSYTSFAYSDLKVAKASDNGLDVSVRVKNTGSVAGDEVPQVYLDAPEQQPDGVQFAPKTLAAFDRVTLASGESKDVTMHVSPRALEYWSVAEKKWVRSDARRVRVGSSSRDLKLTAEK